MGVASGSRADRHAGAQHRPDKPSRAPPQQALPRRRAACAGCAGGDGGFEGHEGRLPPVSRRECRPSITPEPEGARDVRAGPTASAGPSAERRAQSAGPRAGSAPPQSVHPSAEDDAGDGGGPAAAPDAPPSSALTTPPPLPQQQQQQQHQQQQRFGSSGTPVETALVTGSSTGAERALLAVRQVEHDFWAAQAAGNSEAAEKLQVSP